MKIRSVLFLSAVLTLVGCAAENGSPFSRANLLAQRGAVTCTTDANCHQRLPRARACPHGPPSSPSNCCRMGYCGVCWSECTR